MPGGDAGRQGGRPGGRSPWSGAPGRHSPPRPRPGPGPPRRRPRRCSGDETAEPQHPVQRLGPVPDRVLAAAAELTLADPEIAGQLVGALARGGQQPRALADQRVRRTLGHQPQRSADEPAERRARRQVARQPPRQPGEQVGQIHPPVTQLGERKPQGGPAGARAGTARRPGPCRTAAPPGPGACRGPRRGRPRHACQIRSVQPSGRTSVWPAGRHHRRPQAAHRRPQRGRRRPFPVTRPQLHRSSLAPAADDLSCAAHPHTRTKRDIDRSHCMES